MWFVYLFASSHEPIYDRMRENHRAAMLERDDATQKKKEAMNEEPKRMRNTERKAQKNYIR